MAAPDAKDHVIREGEEFLDSPVERWNANVRAIRLVKDLEEEGRAATHAEQEVLGEYSGFGGSYFEQAFSPGGAREPAWERRRQELEDLVTADELEAIRVSRKNAFYTSPEIIDSMWDTLEGMGVDRLGELRVLEPSAGSGRFLGMQPASLTAKSERTAVELDSLTARMLKHLYPKTRVYHSGFEAAPIQDDYYDVAISNVPFGDVQVFDREYSTTGRKYLTNAVHNYFFAKTLDKLRPGGVLAFITSHYTMDAASNRPVRKYLADRADLLGAVRLPKEALPGTEVVTDIIYMRKRDPDDGPGDDSWIETETLELPTENYSDRYYGRNRITVNSYFVDNPDRVLGDHSQEGSMYSDREYTVTKNPDRPFMEGLTQFAGEMKRTASIEVPRDRASRPTAPVPEAGKGEGRYVVDRGTLKLDVDGKKSAHGLSKPNATRVKDLVGLRETARELIDLESSAASDPDQVDGTRDALLDKYTDYINKHKQAVNTKANYDLLGHDADGHLLFALETYDKESECWQAADIMYKRVVGAAPVQRASSAADAMAISLNESGTLNFERMARMLGRSTDEVREELANDGLIFRTADGSAWVPAPEYLTGNVREKLKRARLAATVDPSYRNNINALETVQPERVPAEDIRATLGAPWIPAEVVNEWVTSAFQPHNYGDERDYFTYTPQSESFITQEEDKHGRWQSKQKNKSGQGGGWTVNDRIFANYAMMHSTMGTERMSADKILLKVLEGSPIQVKKKGTPDPEATAAAQQKADQMRQSFADWVWTDPDRTRHLEDIYNDTHNAHRPRIFDGSHQTLPGMAAEWQRQLKKHQRDAIYRVVNDGTTLLAHEVGFGKTASMVASAMERKRLGLANKPLFVVPKATREQFADEFMEIYPGARILVAGDTDFQSGNRERFLSRIATGDWDGVIVSGEQFSAIPLLPETEAKWLRKQRDDLEAALVDVDTSSAGGRRAQNDITTRIRNYETRLRYLVAKMQDRSDDVLAFEQLGVDQLYVDEADRYKNLPYTTRMGGVKGLPQTESQRAWDMYMKIRHLQEKHGEKPDGRFAKGGVVFATGTPVANTIAEAYTMMRYLQPGEMKRRGLESFDAWAQTYGLIKTGIEVTPAGKYKPTQRFSRFVNLPELGVLFQHVADIRVASEVPEMVAAQPLLIGDDNQQGDRVIKVAPTHRDLQDYMRTLVKRVNKLGQVDPREDNMLKISNDARKAALDVRMVNPDADYNPSGKIAIAAANIAEIHDRETPRKGVQLVFLDLGTPKANDKPKDTDTGVSAAHMDEEILTGEEQELLTNVYASIRSELVGRGVNEDEIAFIHDYKTPAQRESLFEDVRAGEVRVLVGSTEKIGVGVNVQDRAAAAHHIDVPWRPRDLEQREGRIIRQGNKVYGPVIDKETEARISPGRGVHIFLYVQQGSFDNFMWNAIEEKARGIKALMKRDQPHREMDDIDPFVISAAEAKALASGNPLAMRSIELEQEIFQGQLGRAAHRKQVATARGQVGELDRALSLWRAAVPRQAADAEYVESLDPDAPFAATMGRTEYDERPDASKALEQSLRAVPYDPAGDAVPIGRFKGFEVFGLNTDRGYQVRVSRPDSEQTYTSAPVERGALSATGVMRRLDNLVKGIPKRAQETAAKLEEGERSYQLYGEQVNVPFTGADKLAFQERQLRVIKARLAEKPDMLLPGDDYEMNVMQPWAEGLETGGDATVVIDRQGNAGGATVLNDRETTDAGPVTLQDAVEAMVGADAADTPEEVAEVLRAELANPATPDALKTRNTAEPVDATAAREERIAEIEAERMGARAMFRQGIVTEFQYETMLEKLDLEMQRLEAPPPVASQIDAADAPASTSPARNMRAEELEIAASLQASLAAGNEDERAHWEQEARNALERLNALRAEAGMDQTSIPGVEPLPAAAREPVQSDDVPPPAPDPETEAELIGRKRRDAPIPPDMPMNVQVLGPPNPEIQAVLEEEGRTVMRPARPNTPTSDETAQVLLRLLNENAEFRNVLSTNTNVDNILLHTQQMIMGMPEGSLRSEERDMLAKYKSDGQYRIWVNRELIPDIEARAGRPLPADMSDTRPHAELADKANKMATLLSAHVAQNKALQNAIAHSDQRNIDIEFENAVQDATGDLLMETTTTKPLEYRQSIAEVHNLFSQSPEFKAAVMDAIGRPTPRERAEHAAEQNSDNMVEIETQRAVANALFAEGTISEDMRDLASMDLDDEERRTRAAHAAGPSDPKVERALEMMVAKDMLSSDGLRPGSITRVTLESLTPAEVDAYMMLLEQPDSDFGELANFLVGRNRQAVMARLSTPPEVGQDDDEATAAAAAEPNESRVRKPSADEMLELAETKGEVIAITGPDSLMERMMEEGEERRQHAFQTTFPGEKNAPEPQLRPAGEKPTASPSPDITSNEEVEALKASTKAAFGLEFDAREVEKEIAETAEAERQNIMKAGEEARAAAVASSPELEPARETEPTATQAAAAEPAAEPETEPKSTEDRSLARSEWATHRLAEIREHLEHGNDVYLSTYTHHTRITPKTLGRWESGDRPLLKVGADGALLMWEGGRYVDASGSKMTAMGTPLDQPSPQVVEKQQKRVETWDRDLADVADQTLKGNLTRLRKMPEEEFPSGEKARILAKWESELNRRTEASVAAKVEHEDSKPKPASRRRPRKVEAKPEQPDAPPEASIEPDKPKRRSRTKPKPPSPDIEEIRELKVAVRPTRPKSAQSTPRRTRARPPTPTVEVVPLADAAVAAAGDVLAVAATAVAPAVVTPSTRRRTTRTSKPKPTTTKPKSKAKPKRQSRADIIKAATTGALGKRNTRGKQHPWLSPSEAKSGKKK